MARGKSVKLLAEIPEKYTPDFMSRLDKRTVLGKAIRERYETVVDDLGGPERLSHVKHGVIRRLIWMEAVIEGFELRLAEGKEVDVGAYTQLTNSWLGLARQLGLERKPRQVKRLHQHMQEAG